jgi:hypothetical protein
MDSSLFQGSAREARPKARRIADFNLTFSNQGIIPHRACNPSPVARKRISLRTAGQAL